MGGIIIGGGDTASYRKHIVETELFGIIRDKFRKGCPIAGFSAGALILPEYYVISSVDNPDHIQEIREGLGLLQDVIISAHFLEWKDWENLKQGVRKTSSAIGFGVAENSGICLKNGRLVRIEGFLHVEYLQSTKPLG